METEINSIVGKIMDKLFYSLTEFFLSMSWLQIVSVLKIISIIFSLFFLISIIILIFKIKENIRKSIEMVFESIALPDSPKKIDNQQWQSVLSKLENEGESSYKLAVIEADKIFDDLLKRMGYQGDDMGERLKQVSSDQLAHISQVWQAHKIRNRLVHELDFQLKKHEAKQIIEIYQKALNDLEAI